jgi:hypothetical protein
VDVTCTIAYAIAYLDSRDPASLPTLLGSLARQDTVAAAKASGLCRFTTTFDVTGLEHPRERAEAEFVEHIRRRGEDLPAVPTDPAREQWQAERARAADLQRLTMQLYEAKLAAGSAHREAARLLAQDAGEEASAAEETAARLDRRVGTLEKTLARIPTLEKLARRDAGRPQRLKQQAADQAFAGANDQQLAEVYRRLGKLVFQGEDGQQVPAAQLLFEACWRGALAELLRGRLGVQKS